PDCGLVNFHLSLATASLGVQAALRLLETGPAPGARVFARQDRAGAVGAANAWVVLIVERIIEHVVGADVVPDLVPGPIGQRVQFRQLEFGVPLELASALTRGSLVAADAGDPGVELLQLRLQRLDLAQVAALVGLAAPKRLTVLTRLLLGGQRRAAALNLNAVALFNLLDECVGLRKEKVRIQREDAKRRGRAPRH